MKLSRELAQASRNHEVLWIYLCGAKPCLLKKKPWISVPKKICDNLWTKEVRPQMFFYRPQINTDWHRLRAKGSD